MKNYSNCPICNGTPFSNYISCKDYTVSKNDFQIVKCDNCSFAFTNPIPLENEIGKYYESDEYISHSNSSKGIVNKLYQTVRNYTLKQKVALLKSLSSNRSLLDIGSGTGEFLNACKNNGFDVSGIEPSSVGRKQTIENYGINPVEESALNEFEEESFGIVTMWHVLEHVYNLNERVEQIKRILKKGGILIVAVPNLTSYDAKHYKQYWAAYDVPRHLYHFSPKDIKELFSKYNFTLEKTLPMKFDSFYVSMLSEKYKTGKNKLFSAFLTGLKSNLKAKPDSSYSSQIYILKKG